jgi:hypothetical protein
MNSRAVDPQRGTAIRELVVLSTKLLETAQRLHCGPERAAALEEISRFQGRLALLVLESERRTYPQSGERST